MSRRRRMCTALILALATLALGSCGTTPKATEATAPARAVTTPRSNGSAKTSRPEGEHDTATTVRSGTDERASVQSHRRTWDEKHPSSYRFEIKQRNNHYTTVVQETVESGQVSKTSTVSTSKSAPRSVDPTTIDEVFDQAERWADTADKFTIEYDETYGYPKVLSIDPKTSTNDDERSISISAFEQL